jgi:propanol-preferring alcohol dehydrogenase
MARIPKECDLEAIAPVLCAGITVYKGLKESGVRPGETVAIVGAGGGLGSLACQYAKAMGLDIIAIDGGDEKRDMTKKLGAQHFIDFTKSKNIVSDVKAATSDGLGPHAVILVAVNEKPFQQAAEVCTIIRVSNLITNLEKVCATTRHRCCYRYASGCLPQSSSL